MTPCCTNTAAKLRMGRDDDMDTPWPPHCRFLSPSGHGDWRVAEDETDLLSDAYSKLLILDGLSAPEKLCQPSR